MHVEDDGAGSLFGRQTATPPATEPAHGHPALIFRNPLANPDPSRVGAFLPENPAQACAEARPASRHSPSSQV
ncbi:hypothetical protein WDZ92_49785, partial [Nostoc sp. NIES-2111]